jgi:hypothetical protein
MATQPVPPPNRIDPVYPEETPVAPSEPVPETAPDEAPVLPPDIDEPKSP